MKRVNPYLILCLAAAFALVPFVSAQQELEALAAVAVIEQKVMVPIWS